MGTIKEKVDKILQTKQQKIIPDNIKDEIQIFDVVGTYEGEGYITTDATAQETDIIIGKTAYVSTGKITGAIQKYINTEITPSIQLQEIEEGFYKGLQIKAVTSAIDPNIIPENILEDITILGVTGTAKVNPLDATASASDILESKTAYINEGKVNGTMLNNGNIMITPSRNDITIPQGYHNGTGYVKAVDNTIDYNIRSNNIKAGITILGVTGSLDYIDTSDATANASTILENQTAYVNGQKITGTIINRGTVHFYPRTSDQEISPGYISGGKIHAVTSAIDSNIIPGNIKQGITILGVEGALTDQGIDTSDATALATDILANKTAYVNGQKITGTAINRGDAVIYPQTYSQTLDSGYYNSIYINSVTSSIDTNIIPENILNGTTILGVTGTLIPSGITPMDFTVYPSDTRLEYEDIYCRTLVVEKADSRVDSNIQPQNIRKGVNILGIDGTLDPNERINYEAGTLTFIAGSYANYNPVKQEGSMNVTEFDNNGYCLATNGTYSYIRMYFSLEQAQEFQIEFTKGSYSRFLFSEVDSEMVRGIENITTNVYFDSNLELTNTVIYNINTPGRHFIDVKILSTKSTDINLFKPIGLSILQKLVSQIYASLDAMNNDLSQTVGTYGFLYNIIDKKMVSIYRFDGEKWVQKISSDYTGTISPLQYQEALNKLDELNGEIIEEE